MYIINKVRKKVLINNEYKIVPLWECIAKFGTHSATSMYLFDEPKDGIRTKGMRREPHTPVYALPILDLRIEKVREDGFVFLYLE